MPHLLIIGGSDAGISAALRAREVNPAWEVTVLVADSYPNFSICGLPFYLSGEVKDWRTLAHRSIQEIEDCGIDVLLNHRAERITPENNVVMALNQLGRQKAFKYDSLVVATGAVPVRPEIEGVDQEGVFFLRWMQDCFAMAQYLSETKPRSAAIVGAGYIGMEMADALTRRGTAVTMLARSRSFLKSVDPEMGDIVGAELDAHGVRTISRAAITGIEKSEGRLVLRNANGNDIETELALLATGAAPETEIARKAGILTGDRGAIRVGRGMETNIPNIYAAGDCVETWHRILMKPTYHPLGTTAHKQGRVAGENAVGGSAVFKGSLATQAVKVFDLVVARTGLRDEEASKAGFQPRTIALEALDHKAYYPGVSEMHIRITGDRLTNRLLGAQVIGRYRAEIAKRIDVFATAIFNDMKVEDLIDVDLSYTPPLSSPWDPVQMSAMAWKETQETHG